MHQLSKKELNPSYTMFIGALKFEPKESEGKDGFYDDMAKSGNKGTPVDTWQLPIPVNVTENNTHEWEISKGVTEEIGNLVSGAIDSALGGTLTSATMKTAQSMGITLDPNYRQIYNGSTPRTFSFEWALVPDSLEESSAILEAIRSIKACSLPGPRVQSVMITPPYSFVIRFGNKELDKLINIRECVLTNVTINYTGQGYGNFYAGGHPKKIDLSMTFSERYTLDRDNYLNKKSAAVERGI